MNASKENAYQAIHALHRLCHPDNTTDAEDRETIQQFLDACARKLPSEASFTRDKKRSKK